MPLYEWRCERCELTFEALATFRASKRKRDCPACRQPAPRVMSAASFLAGKEAAPIDAARTDGTSDVTRLKMPSVARPCWMDDRSAARFAAYQHGRGAEYDDTIATREQKKKQYGVVEKTAPHAHGHSPLADPAVFARRAAAARKSAAAQKPPAKT